MRRKAVLAVLAGLAVMAPPTIARADQDSALAAVRGTKGVLDARIDARGNLWVMVLKNTSVAWDQYARYMCTLVRPHDALVFVTHVVDVTTVGRGKKPSEWTQLATVKCGQ